VSSIGMLSLLLAAGIILGIILAIFGFVRRAQGKMMFFYGIVMLFGCLFGLMYLVANFGTIPSNGVNNKHLIAYYQVTKKDSSGNTTSQINGLDNYPKPIYLVGSGDTLALFNQESGALQQNITKSKSHLRFPCYKSSFWTAFCGEYELVSEIDNRSTYQKKSVFQGSTYFEQLQVKSIKNP